MKSSRKSYKLTEVEKREMLEDARDPQRLQDFRKLRNSVPKMTFEKYVRWLTQITTLFHERTARKPVIYKNVLL